MSYRLIVGYCVLATFSLAFLVIVIIVIRVITLDPPAPATPKTRLSTYVVRKGDSLAAISQKSGVPVERIESLNPTLDPLALMPGRRIRLKPVSAQAKRRAAQRRARRLANLPRRYVVKPGDGLFAIAEKTKVDISTLRSLNKKKNLKKLLPGMRLRLRR